MYKIINARQNVPNFYQDKLVNQEKIIEKDKLDAEINQFKAILDDSLNQVVNSTYKIEPRNTYLNKKWASMNLASTKERTKWNTGCNIDLLKFIGLKSVKIPDNFVINI
jgi:2-oxoglutarate dehydrogenase complex dehydrogenase (E1) component-like enzyme